MDDILLILLGIFWAIISIYQSQRKKKQKAERRAAVKQPAGSATEQSSSSAQASQTASENKDFLDKIFDAFGEDSASDPYESFAEEMIQEEEIDDLGTQPKTMSEKSMEEISEQEGGSFLSDTEVSNRLRRKKSTKKADMVRDIARNFDGRKAVIYSEILNRPYS